VTEREYRDKMRAEQSLAARAEHERAAGAALKGSAQHERTAGAALKGSAEQGALKRAQGRRDQAAGLRRDRERKSGRLLL